MPSATKSGSGKRLVTVRRRGETFSLSIPDRTRQIRVELDRKQAEALEERLTSALRSKNNVVEMPDSLKDWCDPEIC